MNAPGVTKPEPHDLFLDEDVADGHEHGERTEEVRREDPLIGTSGSHTPPPDTRADEPANE